MKTLILKVLFALVLGLVSSVLLFRLTQYHLPGLGEFLYWLATKNVVGSQEDFHDLAFLLHILVFSIIWFFPIESIFKIKKLKQKKV